MAAGRDGLSDTFEWSVTPWRREPRRAALAAAILVGAAAGAWWIGKDWFFGVLALVLLWGSLGSFFVTARYVMDEGGVAVDSPFLKRRRAWSDIKAWYTDSHGATLSPYGRPSWLEAYRSLRILYGDHEAEVVRRLREKLGAPAPPGGGRWKGN